MRRSSRWVLLCALCVGVASAPGADATPCECVDDTLDCSFRDRAAIPVNETCPGALKVVLKGNRLQSVPDGLNDDVVEIDISSNRLTALPNASNLNPGLKVLVLSENDIADATDELKSLVELEVLRVSKNRLTSLVFLPEPCGLRRLDASINSITSLEGPLLKCSQLERLNLASNNLAPLPDGTFAQLTRLLHLDMANNPLTHLSSKTFYGPQMLEYLDLSQTQLHDLPEDVFKNVIRLRIIHLSGNKLKTLPERVFKDLQVLEDLYLDENQLEDLPEKMFDGIHSLKHLRVNDNHLTALPVLENCCDELDYAFFHNNNVSIPSEKALRALLGDGSQRYVDLNKNPLRPAGMRWMLHVDDVLTAVAEDDCACGSLHRREATVRLCVDAPCAADSPSKNWVAAVRAAEVDDEGEDCDGCADDDGEDGDTAEVASTARRGAAGEDGAGTGAGDDAGSDEVEDGDRHGDRPRSKATPALNKISRFSICSCVLAYFLFTESNFVIL